MEDENALNPDLKELILRGYPTKEALAEITLSKEQIVEQDIKNVMDSLLSNMTNVASKNGSTDYTANLNLDFNDEVLKVIKKNFITLGFTLTMTSDDKMSYLKISWAE